MSFIARFRGTARSDTFRNTGWSALGSVANGALGAVSSAILARYLGVEDFGTYVLILALLNLVTDLSDLGLGSSMVKFGASFASEGDRSGLARLASVVLRLKLLLGGTVLLVAVAAGWFLTGLIFGHLDQRIGTYFLLSLAAAAAAVPATFFPALQQTVQNFRLYALTMVSRYASKLLLLLLAVLLVAEWDIELTIWIETGSVIVFLVVGYLLSPLRTFKITGSDRELQKKVVGFGKWIVLYQVIAVLGGKVDVFFVGGIADSAALGLYGAAMKIAGVVSVATYGYVTAVLPEFSGIASVKELTERRRRSFPIVLLMIAGIVVLGVIARPLMVFLFGEPYAPAGPLLQVICLGLALNVLGHPFSAVLFSQNRPEVFPVSSLVSMTVFAVANLLFIPLLGVMGAAVAFSLHSVALLTVILFYYRRWKLGVAAQ